MSVLGTEGGPADQAFEHDSSDGPPIAGKGVAFATEDFGSNIVRRSNGRVGKGATVRFTPGVDLASIADREIDLIQ